MQKGKELIQINVLPSRILGIANSLRAALIANLLVSC